MPVRIEARTSRSSWGQAFRRGTAQAERHRSGAATVASKTIISWNLLRTTGASLDDIGRLIRSERPDLLLMQEVTHDMGALCERVGGYFVRSAMPDRIHGLGIWSPTPLPRSPMVAHLPRGAMFQRICQVVELGEFQVANVHLSHGQVLNRRQLRRIAEMLPANAAVLGDFNIVGPALLPGFRDVGPRLPTHLMADLVPLRLDRCLVRGLVCTDSDVLPRRRSDHRPIIVRLAPCAPADMSEPRPGEMEVLRPYRAA